MAKTNTVTASNLSKSVQIVLDKIAAASSWTVKEDTGHSALGTMVRFTAKTVVISNDNLKSGKKKIVLKLEGNKPAAILQQIVAVEKAVKEQSADNNSNKPGKESDTPPTPAKTTTAPKKGKGKTNMATGKQAATTNKPLTAAEKKKLEAAAKKKAAAEKKAADAAAKKAAEEAKPAAIMPVNPAGDKTPCWDELVATADKDEKLESARKEMWSKVGEKYGFSIVPLTRALMIEGLWPVGQTPQGEKATVEMEDGTVEFRPAGYQAIYKKEKAEGNKGIGHYVNTAAAAFGRINMEKGKAEAEAKKAADLAAGKKIDDDKETKELTTKQVNKLLVEIERIAEKLPADQLKVWLETSKAMAPILTEIKEEETALADL